MKHLDEEELVLYFYGESRRAGQIDRHLGECPECSSRYAEVAGTLALVEAPDTPARDESYGEDVWRRIRHDLADQEHVGWMAWLVWHRAALAGAAAACVLLVATVVGVSWSSRGAAGSAAASQAAAGAALAPGAAERVRLVALGDHLEQSERVLLDVVNAQGPLVDVSAQQTWAAALIDSNRLYRDAAEHAGDEDAAALLDELERSLLDITHGPSKLTAAELDRALERLDATTLLFKIRVLSDELHERELAPAKPRTNL